MREDPGARIGAVGLKHQNTAWLVRYKAERTSMYIATCDCHELHEHEGIHLIAFHRIVCKNHTWEKEVVKGSKKELGGWNW